MDNQEPQVQEMDQEQLQIADDGSDVNQPVEEEIPEQNYENEADYMANPSQPPMSQNSSSLSAETMKMLHLFDLSQELYEFGEILGDNLKEIDESLVDIETVGYIRQVGKRLERFREKARDFIVEVFYRETYEKNLYIYMSLRNEILIMTRFLSEILNLDNLNVEDKESINKKGNK